VKNKKIQARRMIVKQFASEAVHLALSAPGKIRRGVVTAPAVFLFAIMAFRNYFQPCRHYPAANPRKLNYKL
jgi:hypothetical protein